ncbi:hypothetical protein R6Z07F_013118 [Ovis aries]
MLLNKRSPCNEEPVHCDEEEQLPLTATRESLHTAAKTQNGRNLDSQNHPGSFNINLRSGCPWEPPDRKGAPELAARAGTQDPGSPASPAAPPTLLLASSARAGSCTSPNGFREAGWGGPGWAAPPERLVSAGAGGDREETDLSPPPRAVRVPSPQRSPNEVGETPAGSWTALGSPTPTPVGLHPHPPSPQHPRPHLGSALGPGALTAELQWGRGDRPRRGRARPVQGPRCLETDPALGTGREQPWRSCFFPLPPRPPEKPWGLVSAFTVGFMKTWFELKTPRDGTTSTLGTPQVKIIVTEGQVAVENTHDKCGRKGQTPRRGSGKVTLPYPCRITLLGARLALLKSWKRQKKKKKT